jgi:guanosine-3',5'-bis(diphosphate) 3'-pyrophosphohydrolase
LIIRAMHYAAMRHRDQTRKDGRTPYINHPIALAATLSNAGVREPSILAAAMLHDLIEDTATAYTDLRAEFGSEVADLVLEVTDTKFLSQPARKRLQRAKASHASEGAKLIKLADKICNLRDILARPPADWAPQRKQEYFDWASSIVAGLRGAHPRLERQFDQLALKRPVG